MSRLFPCSVPAQYSAGRRERSRRLLFDRNQTASFAREDAPFKLVRAGWILREGGCGARQRDFQRLLKPTSLVTFLFGDKKVTFPHKGKIYSKSFPQGLWNVERQAVEKLGAKISSTVPVENFYFSTLGLWKKSC